MPAFFPTPRRAPVSRRSHARMTCHRSCCKRRRESCARVTRTARHSGDLAGDLAQAWTEGARGRGFGQSASRSATFGERAITRSGTRLAGSVWVTAAGSTVTPKCDRAAVEEYTTTVATSSVQVAITRLQARHDVFPPAYILQP